jgi:hypothetical protein
VHRRAGTPYPKDCLARPGRLLLLGPFSSPPGQERHISTGRASQKIVRPANCGEHANTKPGRTHIPHRTAHTIWAKITVKLKQRRQSRAPMDGPGRTLRARMYQAYLACNLWVSSKGNTATNDSMTLLRASAASSWDMPCKVAVLGDPPPQSRCRPSSAQPGAVRWAVRSWTLGAPGSSPWRWHSSLCSQQICGGSLWLTYTHGWGGQQWNGRDNASHRDDRCRCRVRSVCASCAVEASHARGHTFTAGAEPGKGSRVEGHLVEHDDADFRDLLRRDNLRPVCERFTHMAPCSQRYTIYCCGWRA